jgi:membrane peptidoglycan carboxypeptidase
VSGNRSNPAPKKAAAGSGAVRKSPQKSTQGSSGKGSGNGSGSGSGGGSGNGSGNGSGRSRTVGARIRTVLKWLFIVGLVCTLILAGIGYFAYRNTTIPNANKAFEAQSTFVYYAGGKSKIGRFADQNRESIPLADIPQTMQDAAIAAEDRTFYTNSGIDPKGILRAAFSNAKGNATQGASTITQQYVKILYLSQERTLSRKVKEAFLSLKVQQEKSKEAILEGYLNTIYFGRGAYGVQAAANAYFNKPAKKLTVPESAMLAAILNSPNYLSPDRGAAGRQALVERYDYVLNGMVSMGNLDAGEADKYAGTLPKLGKQSASNMYGGQRGFMLSMVKDELQRLGFDETAIDAGGLRVETTFTRKAMQAAEDGVLKERPQGLKKLHVATASVDVQSGALLGFYAGQDYLQSQLNWARLGASPGSSFKPFALAAGLKDGFSLKDTFDGNAPFELPDGGGEVGNQGDGQGRSYGSAISLLTATENSVNTAYVDLTTSMEDGPQKVVRMANALGVPKNAPGLKPFPAVALGSATVSPIDMANSYATIANGGTHHDWFMVKKVTRASDGKVLYTAPRKKNRVLSEDLSSDVSYALQETVKNGTARTALELGRPAAAKTGTATNANDDVSSSWFVGYTPQVATAVMYARGKGNEALNGYLPSFYGGDFPAATWTAVMESLMDGVTEEDFPEPAFVDGEAPAEGHAPYVPPPPKPKATKKNKPKPRQTQAPAPAPPPAPPKPQPPVPPPSNEQNQGGGCPATDPNCNP